jgi:hypothetical protein
MRINIRVVVFFLLIELFVCQHSAESPGVQQSPFSPQKLVKDNSLINRARKWWNTPLQKASETSQYFKDRANLIIWNKAKATDQTNYATIKNNMETNAENQNVDTQNVAPSEDAHSNRSIGFLDFLGSAVYMVVEISLNVIQILWEFIKNPFGKIKEHTARQMNFLGEEFTRGAAKQAREELKNNPSVIKKEIGRAGIDALKQEITDFWSRGKGKAEVITTDLGDGITHDVLLVKDEAKREFSNTKGKAEDTVDDLKAAANKMEREARKAGKTIENEGKKVGKKIERAFQKLRI